MKSYSHAKAEKINNEFKKYEYNYDLTLKDDKEYIIRFDGVGMTKAFMSKPELKKSFLFSMKEAIERFMLNEKDLYFAYSYSDEVSIYLEKQTILRYKNRVEKLISILASKLTAAFYIAANNHNLDLSLQLRSFDARIIELDSINYVIDYFLCRQSYAISSHLIFLRNKYLDNYYVTSSTSIINQLKNIGIDYEAISRSERLGLLFVNKEYQVVFEFLADKNRLEDCFEKRKKMLNPFFNKKNKSAVLIKNKKKYSQAKA